MSAARAGTRKQSTTGPSRSGGPSSGATGGPRLRCRLRLAEGRVFDGELPAARHRAIQLGMLHSQSEGFLELTPGTRPADGRLELDRRTRAEHFLPAGAEGGERWLERALYHAERIIDGAYARRRLPEGPREEVFLGVAPRLQRAGGREHVAASRWLWVDVDDPGKLGRLYAFLAERPCHLLVESAGSGGVHGYWKLDRPLEATEVDEQRGEVREPIERANLRLIAALGADRQCRDRGRVLRLAGSRNFKTGNWARIKQADLTLAAYTVGELVGDLSDPEPDRPTRTLRPAGITGDDPYRQIPAADYIARILGLQANRAGFVRCPTPGHEDRHPSCRVGGDDPTLWRCFSCGAGGTIFDAASIRLGGPFGAGRLRHEDFKRAKALVAAIYGDRR